MFRKDNSPVQITVPGQKRNISGVVLAAAAYGLVMCFKEDSSPTTKRELVPATGKRGALLSRDVLSDADWRVAMDAQQLHGNTLQMPESVGSEVSCTYPEWSEVEGDVHLHASLDENVDLNVPLTTAAGKLVPWDGDQETPSFPGDIVGYLRKHLPVKTAGNPTRILVEWVQ